MPFLLLLLLAIVYYIRRFPIRKGDWLLIAFLASQLLFSCLALYLEWLINFNIWVFHVNCLVTQAIFTLYFLDLFRHSRARRMIQITGCIFLVFFLLSEFFLQPYYTFNSYSYALGASFLVLYGLIAFYRWMQVLPATNILALKEFWGAAGVLFYFGSTFFIFISYEYLIRVTPKTVGTLWLLQNFFLGLCCIIFTKAILTKEWIRESSSSSALPSFR